jgi:hypothetical protein
MSLELTAVEARAQDAAFVAACRLTGLAPRLPLTWPTPADTPPAPKLHYRSHYVYLGWQDLLMPAVRHDLSDFDWLLRLIDFTGLRPVLAQRLGWTSARGWKPFDPISLFLLVGWQLTQGWNRAETLTHLRQVRYADYAQRFGFHDGVFPTEGGVRYFLTALGQHSETAGQMILVDEDQTIRVAVQLLNQLLVQSVALMRQADVISPEAWSQALVCLDGMLHPAASRLRCSSVTDTCYQPTSPSTQRPCPAKDKGREGCNCDTLACATVCQHAPVRDPQARFVWYSASNQSKPNPNRPADPSSAQPKRGKGVFGYASQRLQLADPGRRFSVVLLADFGPANRPEDNPGAALLLQLNPNYPDLHLDAVAGDAAYGHDRFLTTIRRLKARRVVDLRADPSDADKSRWPVRGYDDRGRPVCAFGYAFTSNGFDFEAQRHKWVCAQACRRDVKPRVKLPDVAYPPRECPYRGPDHPHGRVLNIGDRFADDSNRLTRDVPFGSSTWKRLYRRARNAVEARHGIIEHWDLKRMPVYGLLRSKALAFMADFWGNLMTLARLIREATAATGV